MAASGKKKTSAPAPLPSESLAAHVRGHVGGRYRLDEIRDAATSLLAEWKKDKFPPAFGPAWAAGVQGAVAQVDLLAKGRAKAEQDALPSGKAVRGAVGAAKDLKRAFVAAVGPAGMHEVAPKLGKTWHSPLPLADQMDAIAAFAESHLAELAPYGFDAAAVAGAKQLVGELRSTHDEHSAALKGVSDEAHNLQAAKGTVYLELKRLSRAAQALPQGRRERYVLSRYLHPVARRKRPAPPPAQGAPKA